jgi:hypothetical protein
MSTDHLKLLLAELEVEVVQEALELYLKMRREPTDRRFEYRYRAARSVLESLRQGSREFGTISRRDDDEETVVADQRSERRPLREQVED